jgi:hypothetical protein
MSRALRSTTDAKEKSHSAYLQPVVSTCTHSLTIIIIYNKGCAWPKQLLGSILRRLRFEPRLVHVGFVVDKAGKGQVFLRARRAFPANLIPPKLHTYSYH